MSFKALVVTALFAIQQAAPLPALHVVSLETLAANYREYDGKDIVVAGIVIVGPESMFMAMPITSPRSEQEAMWVQMSSALARKPGRLETEYLRQQKAGGLITAILRGRFEGSDRRAFGHLICCRFKLEVTKVLSVG